MQSISEWAQLNFADCELGDKRRAHRLVQVAEEIANHPAASLSNQIEHWGDLKAAYRLFDREVAIKIPHPGLLIRPKTKQRFLREARVAARPDHPHLFPTFEAGEVHVAGTGRW